MCCESKDYLFTNFSKKKTFLLTFSIVFSISSLSWPGLMQFLGQNSANVSSAAANAIMMQRLLGTGYELHPLGSRKDNDPMAHIKVWPQPMPKTRFCHRIHRKWSKYAKIIAQVARSSKGWHCPQCIHISSTKGNLKSHILAGRHKTYTEKPFGCQYCDRSYGTKQSLQVGSFIINLWLT